MMPIPRTLQEALVNRKLIPFLGAGFSIPSGLPSWGALVQGLAQIANVKNLPENELTSRLSLPDLSEIFDSLSVTEHAALSYFGNKIDDPRIIPSNYHQLLNQLAPSIVITTNWDRMIEESFRSAGLRVVTIKSDSDIVYYDTVQHINLLKIHGCVSDLKSLIYRKSHYEQYWKDRQHLLSLLSILLTTQHAIFLGYGFGDPNILDLLTKLQRDFGRFKRQHWALSYGAPELERLWQLLGVEIIPASHFGDPKDRAGVTEAFLKELVRVSGSISFSNRERADLINREIQNEIKIDRRGAILRMRGSLGWLSNPTPDPSDPIYGSFEQDSAERRMTELVVDFLKQNSSHKVKCILHINGGPLSARYKIGHIIKRLQTLRECIKLHSGQVDIVHAEHLSILNEMIFDQNSSLMGFKTSSRVGIARVSLSRDARAVGQQALQFDADFDELVLSQAGLSERDVGQATVLCRLNVLQRIEQEIERLRQLEARDEKGIPITSHERIDRDVQKLADALLFAIKSHDSIGQKREDGVTPYWVHVIRVVDRLRLGSPMKTDEILIAAALHDVIEDCGIKGTEIEERFGPVVAGYVKALSRETDQNVDSYLAQLRASPNEVMCIKLSDRWDNVAELREKGYTSFGGMKPEAYLDESERVLTACAPACEGLGLLLRAEIDATRAALAKRHPEIPSR